MNRFTRIIISNDSCLDMFINVEATFAVAATTTTNNFIINNNNYNRQIEPEI